MFWFKKGASVAIGGQTIGQSAARGDGDADRRRSTRQPAAVGGGGGDDVAASHAKKPVTVKA